MGNFAGFAISAFNPIGPPSDVVIVSPETDFMLGYSRDEIPAMRTRFQTTAAGGGDSELFASMVQTLNTVLAGAVVGTNINAGGAGLQAMKLASLYLLDPEDGSWGTLFNSLSNINTKLKCWQLADTLIRFSTYHRTSNGGVTCLEALANAGASGAEGIGEAVHIWSGTPTMSCSPVWYVWKRIQGELAPAVSAQYVTSMLEYVTESLVPVVSQNYPEFTGHGTEATNHSAGTARHLNVGCARELLGTGYATPAQEAIIEDAFQKCYLNRVALEFANLHVIDGIPNPAMNEASVAGTGYCNDNASGAARMSLLFHPMTEWRAAGVDAVWLQNLPEQILKGAFPDCLRNSTTGTQVMMLGELSPHQAIRDGGTWMWLMAALMSRRGYITQSQQMRWLMDTFVPKTAISGVSVPTSANTSQFKRAWEWFLVIGGTVFGRAASAISSFTTRKGPLGTRIANDYFDAPTRNSFVAFYPIEKAYTARPEVDVHCGRVDIRTRGSYVRLRGVGGEKGAFGSDIGKFFLATYSRPGFFKLSGMPWTSQGRGLCDGSPQAMADPSMALAENASDFDLVARRYVDDPDHSTGFACGLERFYVSSVATRMQQIVVTELGNDLVFEFIKATPAAGYGVGQPLPSPVALSFADGATTVPDHYLKPGVPAKGVLLSADATTFAGSDTKASGYTSTHNGATQSWPACDAKWFTTVLSAGGHDYRLEIRQYDATYAPAAFRDNLECQNFDTYYGRNAKCAWTGPLQATGDGTATVTLHDSPPVLPNPVLAIALSTAAAPDPVTYGGNYNQSAGTFTITSKPPAIASLLIPAGTYNYDLLDTENAITTTPVEMYLDDSGDGMDVRRSIGYGSGRIVKETASYTLWCVVTALGAASDGAFTAAPTYTTLSGVTPGAVVNTWGVYVASKGVAVFCASAHVSSTDSSLWVPGTKVTIPSLTTTRIHFMEIVPGTYTCVGVVTGGTSMQITLTPSGGGSFVVASHGRIVVSASHAAGVITVVQVA